MNNAHKRPRGITRIIRRWLFVRFFLPELQQVIQDHRNAIIYLKGDPEDYTEDTKIFLKNINTTFEKLKFSIEIETFKKRKEWEYNE